MKNLFIKTFNLIESRDVFLVEMIFLELISNLIRAAMIALTFARNFSWKHKRDYQKQKNPFDQSKMMNFRNFLWFLNKKF